MTRPALRTNTSHGRLPLKALRGSTVRLSKHSASHKTSPSSGKSSKRSSRSDFEDVTDYEEMAALPNFCASCEKQIITPNASILYCSEACRRKDGSKATVHTFQIGLPTPSPTDLDTTSAYPDIVPQRSPTTARPASIASIDSSVLGHRPPMDRSDSEAAKYLSQFLSDGRSASPSRRSHIGRSSYYRNHNASSHTTLPSLSHTPASSIPSASSSYTSLISRTGPTRAAPPWSIRHNSTRSIDLVMPIRSANIMHKDTQIPPTVAPIADTSDSEHSLRSKASTATAFRSVEGEMTYEKKSLERHSPADGRGSLKQLFAHDAMRSASRDSESEKDSRTSL